MEKEKCIHCGNESKQMIYQAGKPFCCEGCLTVYNILNTNKLYDYYQIDKTPGIKDTLPKESYEYLNQVEIKKSVLNFYDGTTCRIDLYIPAIHCSSCIWLLENLNRLNQGVSSSMVNFNKKRLTVTYDESQIKLSELMRLLASIHYRAYIIKEKNEQKKSENKKLIIKLGIAGFAFGNVMLLSFPDYIANDIHLNNTLINVFGYLSILLSLPVLFYSASDYFQSAFKNLSKKIISIDLPIVIGILAIFVQSTFEIITQKGTGYLDSLTGLVFFLLIGKWYQSKTYDALNFENDYTSYFPLGILKVEKDHEKIVPIDQLEEGDLIRVKNGEIIPADSLLLSNVSSVDYSFITGESVPVIKKKDETIYAGGRVIGTSILLKVQKKVEAGYLAGMWKEQGKEQQSKLSSTLNTVSKYFTITILIAAALTAIYWSAIDPSKLLFAFTSVLIVACPCALALSIPFAFGHGRQFLGKSGFYLKKSEIIDQLMNIDTLVFDKTGTLTDPNHFDIQYHICHQKADFELVKSIAEQSNHPLSRAIAHFLADYATHEVYAFNEEQGKGLTGTCKGKKVMMGSGQYLQTNAPDEQTNTHVHIKIDDEYCGYFLIKSHYREGWQKLLTDLMNRYEVHILSGDNDKEREILNQTIPDNQVHFFQSPGDKLNYIASLQKQHKKVLMVGDGLNDAGALRKSDAGISVADNIYLFSPSSDAIINASSLKNLPSFLKFSQKNMNVVYGSFVLSFLYNIVGIYFAATGQLSPIIAAILMPLSSITVVAFTSLSTILLSKQIKLK